MNSMHIPYRFDTAGEDIAELDETTQAILATDKGRSLFCGACGHLVTYERERIPVGGTHNHTCTNPAGIVYNIGCFHLAPGCAVVGRATAEYTWFTGYTWQIAVCANCGEHLGWFFQDGNDFYGLITARLASRH